MTDIFDQSTEANEPTETDPNTQTQDDILAALVGEGKKYKTVDDLAKSRLEADKFIEQLKSENAEIRRDLAEKEGKLTEQTTLDDVLAKIEAARKGTDNQTDPTGGADIQEIVKAQITAAEKERTALLNREKAQAAVLSRFNNNEEKAKEFTQKEAARLGITTDMLGEIAATSPQAFERMLGLRQSGHSSPSIGGTGDVNTGGSFSNAPKRNAAYYSNLRREMGSKYYEPRIQQQLMKDRMSMSKEEWDNN